MKPTNIIELIVCALGTQEGAEVAGSIPDARNNPCDLRYAGQAHASAPGWDKATSKVPPIATFTGDQDGSALQYGVLAGYRDVLAKAATGMTLRQLVFTFAPPNENNTNLYLENVLKWTGLPADVPIVQLLAPLMMLNRGEA